MDEIDKLIKKYNPRFIDGHLDSLDKLDEFAAVFY